MDINNIDIDNIYTRIYDEVNLMIAILSTDQTLLKANNALLNFAGVSLESIIGKVAYELPWWQHSKDLKNQLIFSLEEAFMNEVEVRFSATHQNKDGELHEIDYVIKPIMKDGLIHYFLAMGYNITELVRAQEALTKREKQIQAFFDFSNDGYFFMNLPGPAVIEEDFDFDEAARIVDALKISSYNHKLTQILGCDDFSWQTIKEELGLNHRRIVSIWENIIRDGNYQYKSQIIKEKSSKEAYIDVRLHAIFSEEGYFQGCFGIIRDITTQQIYENELNFLAKKDPLTELNNRRSFFELADNLVIECKEKKQTLTVVMMDLDHFKSVNDNYGHEVGDIVLKHVASKLLNQTTSKEITGRYGGEEFIMLSKDSLLDTAHKLDAFRLALSKDDIAYDSGQLKITMSMGIASYNGEEKLAKVISQADKALYDSKMSGRNRLTIYKDPVHNKKNDML